MIQYGISPISKATVTHCRFFCAFYQVLLCSDNWQKIAAIDYQAVTKDIHLLRGI